MATARQFREGPVLYQICMLTLQGVLPDRAPMEAGDDCLWYLIKLPDDRFAVQYCGDNADIAFSQDLTGAFKS